MKTEDEVRKQRKRHVKITIDIPNEVGFDWDAAIEKCGAPHFPTPRYST